MRPPPRTAPAAALALLLAATPVPAGAADDGLPEFLAPIRAGVLAHEGKAVLRSSESDIGSPGDAFDGKTGTVLRTRGVNPAFLEIAFDGPREVISAEAFFPGGDPHEWSLLAGDDPDRLRVLFERRRVNADCWSRVEKFGRPLVARVFRVVVKRLSGDDHVHFGEIALQARQKPVSVELLAPSTVVCPGGNLVLRARVSWDGGWRSNAAAGLDYELPRYSPAFLEPRDPNDSNARTVRFDTSGTARVRAFIPGRGFRIESEWMDLECRSEGKPDWCVTYIERTPRLPYDGPDGGLPVVGSAVVYRAHVKNYGTANAPRVPFLWQVDGKTVEEGTLDGLERFQEGTAQHRMAWDGARHDVRFVVDPSHREAETSKANNARTVQTDALLLGLWVEQPLLDWFHRVQPSFGDGAAGWEDWAQRQVARWNAMLEAARHPLTPKGCTDRVALDLVVAADEGALPVSGGIPTNDPDAGDRTVDLQWGFPASLLDGDFYRRVGARRDGNPLWFEGSLLHELSHARYLVDLYRLNVHVGEVDLDAPDGSPLAGSRWLPVIGADAVYYTGSGRMMAGDYAGGYGPHEAYALERIARRRARGSNRNAPPVIGEYLADLPRTVAVRVLGGDGRPLDGVRVRAWRRTRGADGRERFGGEPVREGSTADGGILDLSVGDLDPFFEGRREGAFDAGEGVLLLELARGNDVAWRCLEVVPFNLAFWSGKRDLHVEDVATDLPR